MAKWNILLSCILRYTVNIHIVQGKKQIKTNTDISIISAGPLCGQD